MNFTRMISLIAKELNKAPETRADMVLAIKMAAQIELWSKMLQNKAFWLNKNVKSYDLPTAIASETARLVTLELNSEISGSLRAEYLQKSYAKMLKDIQRYVGYGCAKGGLAFKPYVTEQGISIQFTQADTFFPVSSDDSGNITRCVFAEQMWKGQSIFTRLEDHELKGDKLCITNHAYRSTTDTTLGIEVPVQSVQEWLRLEYEIVLSGVSKVPFGYFKVPLANADDIDSPFGCSVHSRAVDLIREASVRYSQISRGCEAKEVAVHIGGSMLQDDPNDKGKKLYPHGKGRLYRPLIFSVGARDKPLMDTFNPGIRSDPLFKGFNAQLKLTEFNCSLAYGTISDPQNVDKTAEEIKSSKQRLYILVSDMQVTLQDTLTNLIDAIDFYCSIYNPCPYGSFDISFDWDDSIAVDAEKECLQDMQEVCEGLIPKWRYKVKWQGLTEKWARAELAAEEPQGINFPGDE